MQINKIHIMDCVKGMKKHIPDKTIDVNVTSPPYNIGINYNSYNDNRKEEEFLSWFYEVAEELRRVLKNDGSFFLNIGGKPSNPLWPIEVARKTAELFTLQNTIHWIKSISIPKKDVGNYPHILQDLSTGHFKPVNSQLYVNGCHEYIFHFTKFGDVEIDKLANGVAYQDKSNIKRWKSANKVRDRGNSWFIPYETIRESRPHPSIFPVKLPEMCIKLHGLNKTKLVLDPFMGISSTALASIKLGVGYVGFEIDESYVKIGRERINKQLGKDKTKNISLKRGDNKLYKIIIENLAQHDVEPLFREVRGKGGFQSFIKKLQRQYSEQEQLLILESNDIEKLLRYTSKYGQGGFQNRIIAIMKRIGIIQGKLQELISVYNETDA